jgi:hypothetical protein
MTTQEPSGVILVEAWIHTQGDTPVRKGPLTIVVDGQVLQGRFAQPEGRPLTGLAEVWGNRIPVTPGTHTVKICYPLRRKAEAGVAQVQVDVPAGTECRLHYRTSGFSLRMNGRIKVNPATWRPPANLVELGPVPG